MFKHNYCSVVGSIAGLSYLTTYPKEIIFTRSVPTIFLHSIAAGTGKTSAIATAAKLHAQPNTVSFKFDDFHFTLV